jgi:uncharacterized membrane protein
MLRPQPGDVTALAAIASALGSFEPYASVLRGCNGNILRHLATRRVMPALGFSAAACEKIAGIGPLFPCVLIADKPGSPYGKKHVPCDLFRLNGVGKYNREAMITFLRYLQFLSLGIWVGSIVYMAFVVAPAAFTTLPTPDLAGAMVGVVLTKLHWLGVICGGVYVAAAMSLARSPKGFVRAGALAVIAMVALTLVSQLGIISKMDSLRAAMGSYEQTPASSPLRRQFDRLHVVSVRIEGAVLILGLAAIFLTVRELPR